MIKTATKKPMAGYKALAIGILTVIIMFEVLMPILRYAWISLFRYVIVPIFTSPTP